MNLGTFISQVQDFANRKDLTPARVRMSANLAKLALQRDNDLTFVLKKWDTTYVLGGIVMPSDFKSFPYKRSVIITDPQTGKGVPIEGTNYDTVLRRIAVTAGDAVNMQISSTNLIKYFIQFLSGSAAPTLSLTPELAASLTVWYNAFLPEYSADSDEDILLIVGRDALFWKTLVYVNVFYQAEEKLTIDSAALADAVQHLQEHCRTVIRSGASIER